MIHKWWLPVGIPLRHSLHLGIYSTCPQSQKVSISVSISWAGLATFQRESWDSETSVWSKRAFFFFFFFNCLTAALGLHCCSRTFSSCGQGEMLLAVVRGLLTVLASLVVEHGLSPCGIRAWLLPGVWNLSPVRDWTRVPCIGKPFLATAPAGKSRRGLSWT